MCIRDSGTVERGRDLVHRPLLAAVTVDGHHEVALAHARRLGHGAVEHVHDAYARAIKPVHTLNDGDTVFAFASGEVEALPDAVSVLACEAMQGAIVRAVCQAEGACGLPAARDLVAGR